MYLNNLRHLLKSKINLYFTQLISIQYKIQYTIFKAPLYMQEFPDFMTSNNTTKDSIIFEKLFTAPKRAFAFIHKHKYEKFLLPIIMANGISNTLEKAVVNKLGNSFSLTGLLFFCIIFGAIFGYLTFLCYSFFTDITGQWIKGKATTHEILRVLTYSMVPSLLVLLLFAIKIIVFGHTLFSSDFYLDDYNLISRIIYFGTSFAAIGVSIWSFVLFVIGVAEVQEFTYAKALLNVLLPALVLIILGIIVFIVVDLFSH